MGLGVDDGLPAGVRRQNVLLISGVLPSQCSMVVRGPPLAFRLKQILAARMAGRQGRRAWANRGLHNVRTRNENLGSFMGFLHAPYVRGVPFVGDWQLPRARRAPVSATACVQMADSVKESKDSHQPLAAGMGPAQ